MKTFSIDSENAITKYDSASEVPKDAKAFSSEEELNVLAEGWPGSRLVDIWNGIAGVPRVTKFTSRKVAVRRIWAALQSSGAEKAPKAPAPKPARSGAKPAKTPATKTVTVIALLKRPEGATLKQLMSATGWQPHSVRGFISAQLGKRMKLRVKSFTREGERVYKIRG